MKTLPASHLAPSVVTTSTSSVAPVETQHQPAVDESPTLSPAPSQQAADSIAVPLPVTAPLPPGAIVIAAMVFDEVPEITNPDSPRAQDRRRPVSTEELRHDLQEWFADGEHADRHLAMTLVHLAHGKIKSLPADVQKGPAVEAGLIDRTGQFLPGVRERVKSCTRPIGEYDVHFHLPA